MKTRSLDTPAEPGPPPPRRRRRKAGLHRTASSLVPVRRTGTPPNGHDFRSGACEDDGHDSERNRNSRGPRRGGSENGA